MSQRQTGKGGEGSLIADPNHEEIYITHWKCTSRFVWKKSIYRTTWDSGKLDAELPCTKIWVTFDPWDTIMQCLLHTVFDLHENMWVCVKISVRLSSCPTSVSANLTLDFSRRLWYRANSKLVWLQPPLSATRLYHCWWPLARSQGQHLWKIDCFSISKTAYVMKMKLGQCRCRSSVYHICRFC